MEEFLADGHWKKYELRSVGSKVTRSKFHHRAPTGRADWNRIISYIVRKKIYIYIYL